MNNETIIVNSVVSILIVLVTSWFFVNKSSGTYAQKDAPIMILIKDGSYFPSLIQIPAGKPTIIRFMRKDPNACASTVKFPQFNYSYPLPLNNSVDITIPPQKAGEIDFTCDIGSYRGKILVI